MQESNTTLPNIILMLEQTKTYLYNIRSDKGFSNILEEAKIIAKGIDCYPSFLLFNNVRPQTHTYSKQLFDHASKDEAPKGLEDLLKNKFYFLLPDTSLSNLEERFERIQNHHPAFDLFKNLIIFLK